MTELRRYRQWAGDPKGQLEDITRCIVEVSDTGRGCLSHQCNRKRGYGPDGLYCAIHNPEKVEARAAKHREKYLAESRKRRIEWLGPELLTTLEKILPDYEAYIKILDSWTAENSGYQGDLEAARKTLAEAKALITKAKGT